MRSGEIDRRPGWHDPSRIDVPMALVIVPLDVPHVHGRGDTGHLVKVAQIAGKIRIVDDAPYVALEMTDIDRIETYERREETPVGFRDARTAEVTTRG